MSVSVPLRGKEGAGLFVVYCQQTPVNSRFPSPCGVRRVRDNTVWCPADVRAEGFRPLAG